MSSSEPLYVSSPTTVYAGAFARTCQATHLMGKVIRVVNDRSDANIRIAETAQLYRTLEALNSFLSSELPRSPAQYATSVALCHGAMLHLCDAFCCPEANPTNTPEGSEMQATAIAGMRKTAEEIRRFAEVLTTLMHRNISAISPLTADSVYMAAQTYAWLAHETGFPEDVTHYHSLRRVLQQMNSRWAVAGEYFKAIDAPVDILYRDSPNI